jgi:hypothetical protein
MISKFVQEAPAPMFLTSFFKLRPENVHNSEKVEIDIQRDEEDVAIPLPDVSAGPRNNENSKWTNKSFVPPIYDEMGALSAWEQIKRQPGSNPFEDPSFARNAGQQAFTILNKGSNKVRRALELMASQVLQNGKISMVDAGGNVAYELDFLPKTAQIATVSTAWATDGSAGAPIADLTALARLIRKNGKRRPDRLVFGSSAIQRFLANAVVQKYLEKTVLNIGSLVPGQRSEDATFVGMIWIDNYEYEMWRYDGYFKHPQTGTLTPYVADDNVIMLSSAARLDLTVGSIPMFVPPDSRVLQFLPPQIVSLDKGLALTTNAWLSPNGKSLFVSAGSRPLPVPVEIDSFARLDVTP